MKERQADIIKMTPVSKVYMHTVDTGYGFDIDNVIVLDSCSNLCNRHHLESVNTHLQSNSISHTIYLNSSYFSIVYNLKV